MKRVLKFLKPYTLPIILSTIFIFIQSMANLYLPTIMSDIVNQGVVGQNLDKVYELGKYMLIVTLGAMVCNILATFIAAKVSSAYARRLRKAVYEKVQEFSLNEFNKIQTSSLITRTTNDITQIQNLTVTMLRMMIQAPLMCIGGIIMAVNKNVKLSIIFTVVIPLLLLVIVFLAKKIVPLFTTAQKYTDRLNQVVREKLTGTKVIRAFNTEEHEAKRFDKASLDIYDVSIKAANIMAVLMPVIFFMINASTVAIIWFGSKLIGNNALQIGDMMAFMQYAMQVLFSVLMVTMMFIMIPRAIVSAKRVGEVLDSKSKIKDGSKKINNKKRGEIEFKNVSFSYEGSLGSVLTDINFKINKGETVAIIGATGTGKSTILNLILRFYDATKGEVIVSGRNVKDLALKDLRSLIGFVPQKVNLFSGSIKDNIKYGNQNATDEEVIEASKIAEAFDFVNSLDDKFDSLVSQGGTNYSGGQKQRLSIARAIIKKPDIYIFDDSFSALDYATDKKLRENLEKYAKDTTVIIVAQRVATILNADKILYIDDGRIVASGTHKELFEKCSAYKEIVLSQITEEEATK